MSDTSTGTDALRVVVFTSQPPGEVERLVARISDEVPEARIVAILYETITPLPLSPRLKRFGSNLTDPEFLRYFLAGLARRARAGLRRAVDVLIGVLHGTTFGRPAAAQEQSLSDLSQFTASHGVRLKATDDIHADSSLDFVRQADADLGLVFGTRILKKKLYGIPRLGSINIHKRKLPDYRGSGPVGLWELLAGETEIGVTIHRVVRKVDAGAIVVSDEIPIEKYDNLESLALKADLVGADLLVDAVRRIAKGEAVDQPLEGTGRLFRRPEPHRLRGLERRALGNRPRPPRVRTRADWKLYARVALFALPRLARNWHRRFTGTFPVIVLYHHLVSDRDHYMAITTSGLLRQIRFLKRHYRIVSDDEAVRLLESGRVDQPTVVLTFDDGYAANVTHLRAITEATGIPVTHFVCTEHLSSGRPFDHDLRKGHEDFGPMTWEEARLLHRRGARIGSHTRTHFDCGSSDREALHREIALSREDVESELGATVGIFSYPWGDPENISGEAEEIAGDTYDVRFSAYGGENMPRRGQAVRHLLRIGQPNDLLELELALQGALEVRSRRETLSIGAGAQTREAGKIDGAGQRAN